MKLSIKPEILDDIVSVDISVASLGTSTLSEEDEKDMLHNFVKTLEFSLIDFSGNIKVEDGKPIVTLDEADGTSVVKVTIPDLINKKYVIDENLHIQFAIDSKKISTTDIGLDRKVITSPELLAQSRVQIFIDKIKSTIAEKLTEIRALSNDFEMETEVVI